MPTIKEINRILAISVLERYPEVIKGYGKPSRVRLYYHDVKNYDQRIMSPDVLEWFVEVLNRGDERELKAVKEFLKRGIEDVQKEAEEDMKWIEELAAEGYQEELKNCKKALIKEETEFFVSRAEFLIALIDKILGTKKWEDVENAVEEIIVQSAHRKDQRIIYNEKDPVIIGSESEEERKYTEFIKKMREMKKVLRNLRENFPEK